MPARRTEAIIRNLTTSGISDSDAQQVVANVDRLTDKGLTASDTDKIVTNIINLKGFKESFLKDPLVAVGKIGIKLERG